MPSPRRHRKRVRQCEGKAKHATPEAAFQQIKKSARTGYVRARELGIYECSHCGSFHVGHRSPLHPPPSGRVLVFLIGCALAHDANVMRNRSKPDV
jgi:hypothetical protein